MVDVTVSFESSRFSFVSASGAGTSFTSASASGSATTAHFVSYVTPVGLGGAGTVTGSQKVGTVVLAAKDVTSSVNSDITFADSSGIAYSVDSSDIWDHNQTGKTLNIAPKPTTTTTTTTAPKKPAASVPKTTTTQPSAAEQQANPNAPVPVSVTNNALVGYYVSVKVVDSKGKPVSGAKVTLGTTTTTSDSTGLAGFTNIEPGVYKVSVKSGSVLGSATVNVDGTKPNSAVQQFEVKVKPRYNVALIGGIAAGVLLLIIIILIIKGRGGRYKPIKHPGYEVPQAVVGGAAPTPSANTPAASTPAPKDDNLLKPTVIAPGKTVGPSPQ